MFLSVKRIPHPIPPADKPDPKAAQALQEGLGGQFGEMRTMMQYFFQNMNFRGDAKPYQDLLRSMATEEMGHVEQITNTINILLEGASTNSNNPNELPLSIALESPNIHHFLVPLKVHALSTRQEIRGLLLMCMIAEILCLTCCII